MPIVPSNATPVILLIDTDEHHISWFQQSLSSDYICIIAKTPAQAMSLYAQQIDMIKVVIIDVDTLIEPLHPIVQYFKDCEAQSPRILLQSSTQNQAFLTLLLAHQASNYLIKPYSKEKLNDILKKELTTENQHTVRTQEQFFKQFFLEGALSERARLLHEANRAIVDDPRLHGLITPKEVVAILQEDMAISPVAFLKPSVLVVEDEADIREVVIEFLKSWGIESIFSAENGKDALQILEEEWVDIIILDIGLPDISGEEILSRVKEKSTRHIEYIVDQELGIDVISLTCYQDQATILGMIDSGATAYVMKPFQSHDLKKALDEVIDFRHALWLVPLLLQKLKKTLSSEHLRK